VHHMHSATASHIYKHCSFQEAAAEGIRCLVQHAERLPPHAGSSLCF
jgi:hypothetical protein